MKTIYLLIFSIPLIGISCAKEEMEHPLNLEPLPFETQNPNLIQEEFNSVFYGDCEHFKFHETNYFVYTSDVNSTNYDTLFYLGDQIYNGIGPLIGQETKVLNLKSGAESKIGYAFCDENTLTFKDFGYLRLGKMPSLKIDFSVDLNESFTNNIYLIPGLETSDATEISFKDIYTYSSNNFTFNIADKILENVKKYTISGTREKCQGWFCTTGMTEEEAQPIITYEYYSAAIYYADGIGVIKVEFGDDETPLQTTYQLVDYYIAPE